jgi:hypothetical protein
MNNMAKGQRVRWFAYIQDNKINTATQTNITEEDKDWDDEGKD